MGIFKRFRASMTFGIGAVEETMVRESSIAVYRPYSNDSVYAPGYRSLEEESIMTYSSTPVNKTEVKTKRDIPKVDLPKSTTVASASNHINVEQINQTPDIRFNTEAGTSDGRVSNDKRHKERKKDKSKEKNKDKKKKDKRKSQKDKEKQNKSKSKSDKNASKLNNNNENSTTPIESTTIDENIATSAVNPTLETRVNLTRDLGDPPPYTPSSVNIQPKGRSNLTNPLATQSNINAESLHEISSGFTSSWDQVAMHRQNLNKEIRMFKPQNNLRSMMNQDTNEDKNEREVYVRNVGGNMRNAPARNYTTSANNKRNTGRFEINYDSGSEADA